MQSRRIRVLLVEDNPGDVRLTEEALKYHKLACGLFSVRDGAAALRYLRGEREYARRELPDLVFLDLNLPTVPGNAVLSEIRQNPLLKSLPVVVLSSSLNPAEVYEAYSLGASCFLEKPTDLGQYLNFVSKCYEFCCNVICRDAVLFASRE